jgi:hypothetical protein
LYRYLLLKSTPYCWSTGVGGDAKLFTLLILIVDKCFTYHIYHFLSYYFILLYTFYLLFIHKILSTDLFNNYHKYISKDKYTMKGNTSSTHIIITWDNSWGSNSWWEMKVRAIPTSQPRYSEFSVIYYSNRILVNIHVYLFCRSK